VFAFLASEFPAKKIWTEIVCFLEVKVPAVKIAEVKIASEGSALMVAEGFK